MLFATVLYFCVFAVVFYQSEQTAALLGSGTTVVLDAGHGGEDGGATGVSGTSEAALNLEISLRVRDLLRLCGVQVSMIRETDTAVYSDGCRTIAEKKVSDIKTELPWSTRPSSRCCSASIRTFLPRANTMARRSSTPKRLAANSSRSSCRAISPSGWSRTITGSAKIRRRVPDGAYRLHGCAGRVWVLSNYEEEQRLLQPEYQKKLAAVIAGTLSVWLSEEHPNEI